MVSRAAVVAPPSGLCDTVLGCFVPPGILWFCAMTGRQPIPALTGLRFIAALTVLVGHSVQAALRLPGPPPAWELYLVGLSGIGMPLFFVLSGFVIQYNYAETIRTNTAVGIWNFFVARFARLYPLYICAVAFEFVVMGGHGDLPASTGQALPYYLSLTQSWFYKPIDGLPLILRFGLVSQVSWSISTEWFFYLAFPFVCILLAKLKTPRQTWRTIIAFCFAAMVILFVAALYAPGMVALATPHFGPIAADPGQGIAFWLFYFSPYSRLFEFVLGCLCATLYMQVGDRPTTRAGEATALALTGFAIAATLVLVWVFYVLPALPPFLSGSLPGPLATFLGVSRRVFASCFGFAPFIAVIIFCCARYRNPIVGWLSLPLILLGGEASYSLYLLHDFVLSIFRLAVFDASSSAVAVANAAIWVLSMMSVVGLSLVTWRLIEVPARRALRHAQLAPQSRRVLQPAE